MALVLSVALMAQATVVEAYLTTDQNAFTINGKVGIYTIDFRFGHGSHDVYIPVTAMHTSVKTPGVLSYQIVDEELEVAKGTSVGIVLGNAKIKNGMYVVPKGKSVTFTLLTFYVPNAEETETQFRTQVTELPFGFDGTQELQLNHSELQYYTTELLTLTK